VSVLPTPSHESTRPRPATRFAASLAEHGDRCAVWAPEGPLTYADLAARVEDAASLLGTGRRLVLLAAENSFDFLVTYLGALAAGHVPLVVPGDRPQHHGSLVERYSPDVVASRDGAGWQVTHRTTEPAHELHPDLALLLPTSGSTGSPKLVRLSHENLDSNALAIAEALRIRPDDRAATTLPLHYCYGLSVAHSHLAVGASLVLTDLSVVDPCFWDLVDTAGVTSLAGVPHTFELLDRSGFAERDHPSLRVVTQAGGRLAPDAVRRYAALGRSRGWDFFVMYGQTEATARMAVLPPELLDSHAETVGLPVPGGRFRLEPLSELECGLGELVYSGPNVMLGYAEHPGDLTRGRDVTELRTGDLGHLRRDGTVEVVGRRSRFAKVVGLRIDLDRAERDLAETGVRAHCVDLGDAVGVLTAKPGTGDAVTDTLTRRHGIPASGVVVLDGADVLVLPTGKPDYPGMAALVEAHRARARAARAEQAEAGAPAALWPQAVTALYRDLLDAPGADERTSFVDLGGDSLSYVEVSLRLERLLGALPAEWHLLSPAELVAAARPSHRGRGVAVDGGRPAPRWRRGWHAVETSVAVRAVAVLLILANHTHLSFVPGGAHTLLALAGFNLARFQLTSRPRAERAKGIARSVARIWAPSALWIAVVAVVAGTYDWRNVLLLNQVLGDWARWSPHWHYWFIEALVALLLGAALLLSLPVVDRWERRFPFAFPMALVGVGLLTRYDVVVPDAGPYRGANAYVLIWLFATGWAAARARTVPQRLLVSAVPLLTLPGFWPSMPMRGPTIVLGVLALIWLPSVRLPGWLARGASVVAAASLFVYLTHFVVYPHLMAYSSVLAMAGSIAVGVAYHRGWTWLEARGRGTASRVRTHVARARSVRTRADVGS
jgi:acyl-CoA synthetase (AMP-forming)/AMP-acid ligase II